MIERVSYTTSVALIIAAAWLVWATRYEHPLRRAGEFVTSLLNLAFGRPVYLAVLRYRGQQEWKEIFHSHEYVAALTQRREQERTVACSLPL